MGRYLASEGHRFAITTDPAGPAINPLIKMANIVAVMIISLIAIHG